MKWNCREWTAIHDHMPGPDMKPTLRVMGVCDMPHPGYRCRLQVHLPQGTNPQDLLLDLIVQEVPGNWPRVMWPCGLLFESETELEYDTVSIVDVEAGIKVDHPAQAAT